MNMDTAKTSSCRNGVGGLARNFRYKFAFKLFKTTFTDRRRVFQDIR
jgi:hypothetical protein